MEKKFLPRMNVKDKIYLITSTIITTMLGLVLPFSILIIFDRVLPNKAYDTLYLLFFIITCTILIDYVIKNQEDKILTHFMKELEVNLSNKIFESICLSEIEKHKKLQPGDYLERISTISDIKSFFGGEILKAIINFFVSIITITIVLLINPLAGVIILISSIILFIIAFVISNKKKNYLKEKIIIEGLTTSKIIEIISNPLNTKSRKMEYRIESLMNSLMNEREEKSTLYEINESRFNLILTLTQQLSVSLVVLIIAFDVINMNSSQGVMAAVIMLTNRYYSPYQQVIRTFSRWKLNKLYISNIANIINMAYQEETTFSKIKISNIRILLKESKYINFSSGNTYIIKGNSGAGKSYLASCIMRDITNNNIKILLNNKDIKSTNYLSWKENTSLVNKNNYFIEGTIIDNLTSFRPKLNNTAYTLCESMNLKKFIDNLPLGFYTRLKGTNSPPFSRQIEYKLLIIRAFLSEKNLLVFDDIDNIYDDEFGDILLSNSLYRSKNRILILIGNKIKNNKEMQTIYLQGNEI